MDQNLDQPDKLQALIPMIYRDAFQPGVKQLGIALENVIGLVPALTLPAKYVSEKAQALMASHLEAYRKKLEAKSAEKIIPARAEIAAPIFQKLAYTEDVNLANLFIELLTKASHIDEENVVHPSFISLIGDLSSDEALILKYLSTALSDGNDFCALNLNRTHPEATSYEELMGPYTDWDLYVDLHADENLPVYLQNMIRLGILEYRRDSEVTGEQERYARMKTRFSAFPVDRQGWSLELVTGAICVTAYGRLFIKACTSADLKIKERQE